MLRFPQRLVLSGVACALVVAVGLLAWPLATGSSGAQTGSMHNCPPAGKWSIAVWEGPDGTTAAAALAACGEGSVAAAYSLDSQTGAWSRWFAGKPDVSNLPPLNDLQGVLALGSATGPVGTPTPALTATPTRTPTATPTPVATTTPVACGTCPADLAACQETADALFCHTDCLINHFGCYSDCQLGHRQCWADCYFNTWDCVVAASSVYSAWDCFTGCSYCSEIWDCGYCHEIWDCGYCFE